MKDEIKKILDRMKDDIKEHWHIAYEPDVELSFDEAKLLLDYITNLEQEKNKFGLRCFKALKLIRDNYGILDKYGIDMLDDILNGSDDNE